MRAVIFVCAVCLTFPLAAQVKFTRHPDRIEVEINGQPFTAYYAGGEAPKPYLHPLRTASGKIVTRRFPMENVDGETRDHRHHRGLWYTHGDVNGLDFWMNEKDHKVPERRGVIGLKEIGEVRDGRRDGRIRSSFVWQNFKGEPLLAEDRLMVFHADPKLRTIDFDVTFTAIQQVKFGDTKEGFFALRLRDELTENKGTGTMVSAEGRKKMREVWGTRSPWVDYSGTLEGETLGVAIFDHPSNPKHPTYWHSRDYGLFAANALGERDFLKDKTKDGSLTIEPKQSLRFRYRVIIHPGETAEAGIAALWAAYAKTR
jgi:hypothetical protein